MRHSHMRAITTRYKGYAFRSRLEARWAVFFDHLGIKWDYEPEGFELGNGLRYLPDFWLPDWELWIEVKPDTPDAPTLEKARRLVDQGFRPVFITKGMPGAGGTLVCRERWGNEILTISAEADWGATPDTLVWAFSDAPAPASAIDDHYCLGLCDLMWTPQRFEGQLRTAWMDPALEAARGARFEFGAKGGL